MPDKKLPIWLISKHPGVASLFFASFYDDVMQI
jgi:hypothetical protein